ncbi:MAG TPA: ABC transporter substrate-binding protein [Streptosporangiaceae bacterium]
MSATTHRTRWPASPGVRLAAAAAVAGLALTLAACGSASSGGTSSSGGSYSLEIAEFSPFTGPNAPYGYFQYTGCVSAMRAINADGGVLGHPVTCTIVDNRGEPADAVPAANSMLANSPHLVGIVDGDSGLLSATVPLFNQAHITELSVGGDVQFDKNTYPYFWRTTPGDDVAGYTLAAYVKFGTKLTRIASVFGNDQAAQGNVPGLTAGARNLGLTIAVNVALALDQTTYETEVHQILAAHPQVIITESDPQTAGVLLGELKQAGWKGPIVGTSGTLGTDYDKAAIAALGQSAYESSFVRIISYAQQSGPAWQTWKANLLASGKLVKNPAQDETAIYAELPYDHTNMIALAMLAAHSTKPAVFNPYIEKITQGSTVVHTFAEGKAALAAGKTIDYVGVTGQVTFDKYHNSGGLWAAENPVTNLPVSLVSAKDIAAAEGR